MVNTQNNLKSLKRRLQRGEFIVAPGVFELISATLADTMEFSALYMSGNGSVASSLGLPDAGLATYSEMLDRVRAIASATNTPLIADGDTGYGGLLNVDRTVRGYEQAGAAGIQLEDQQSPKKCGHASGNAVIPLNDMVRKVKVAVAARQSDNFLIVARTDARRNYGLNEALKRAQAFEDAGADIIFVEAPESLDEMKIICRTIKQTKLVNMVDGGAMPVLSSREIQELGYNMVIYPCTGFLAATEAMRSAYSYIAKTGSSRGLATPLYDFQEFVRLMGFEDAKAFENHWEN